MIVVLSGASGDYPAGVGQTVQFARPLLIDIPIKHILLFLHRLIHTLPTCPCPPEKAIEANIRKAGELRNLLTLVQVTADDRRGINNESFT